MFVALRHTLKVKSVKLISIFQLYIVFSQKNILRNFLIQWFLSFYLPRTTSSVASAFADLDHLMRKLLTFLRISND